MGAPSQQQGGDKPDSMEGEIVEGGRVESLDEYHVDEKHRADTARYLAYGLVGILALSIVLQYTATFIFVFFGKADASATIDKLFNTLLPVLASLVSAAVTYYFTKDKK
jgi:hypothetical protein